MVVAQQRSFHEGLFGPPPRESCEQKADVSQRNAGKFKSGLIFLGGFRVRISDPMFFRGVRIFATSARPPENPTKNLTTNFTPTPTKNATKLFPIEFANVRLIFAPISGQNSVSKWRSNARSLFKWSRICCRIPSTPTFGPRLWQRFRPNI